MRVKVCCERVRRRFRKSRGEIRSFRRLSVDRVSGVWGESVIFLFDIIFKWR